MPKQRSVLRKLEPRYAVVAACFLATLSAYVERTGFSIAYTAMAEQTNVGDTVKGTVLSSFYWGYAVSQVPGGWAAQRYGGDLMLTLSFLLWSTASILTPLTLQDSNSAGHMVIVARVCIGVAQGFLIPAVHTVLSTWIPPMERARAVSLTTSGMYLGSALAMQVLPGIAARFGPAALLRLVGFAGLGWLILWRVTMLRVRTSTRKHVFSIPIVNKLSGSSSSTKEPSSSPFRFGKRGSGSTGTPWREMVMHPAVWSIVINNFTFHYAFYVIMNWLPTYFEKVLSIQLSNLGILKGVPYITMFLASNAGGWAGDYLIHLGKRSVAGGRKAVNTAGFGMAAIALMLMPGAQGIGTGVLFTTLALGACGFARGGFSVNHMDIAPKFAGVLMGVSNTAGTLAGVVGVAVTGRILERAGGAVNTKGWYQALFLAAVQCLGGAVVFLIFGRGERLFGADTDDFQ